MNTAEASNGTYISNADLKKAMIRPFEQIRKAVGDKMDIHVEFHSMWNLPTAIKHRRGRSSSSIRSGTKTRSR